MEDQLRERESQYGTEKDNSFVADTEYIAWAADQEKAIKNLRQNITEYNDALKENEEEVKEYVDCLLYTSTMGDTDLNDLATQALGDNKSLFGLVIMHSNVAKNLENKQLLEYWKQTDANGLQRPMNIASMRGYTVIIDDNVPVNTVGGESANKDLSLYTTYLLGSGVLRNATARLDHPADVQYEPAKNGGQETLYTRIRETIHPNGFSFKVPSSSWTQSPTDAQLAASANWSIVYNPKSIPMAQLITNG